MLLPLAIEEADDVVPLEADECSGCKRAILAGEHMCDECLAKVAY